MGLKYIVSIAAFLLLMPFLNNADCSWQGPIEFTSGTWGGGDGQFGIEYGDTEDLFSGNFYLLLDGTFIIDDIIQNTRMKMYDASGQLIKIVKCIRLESGELNEQCRLPLADYIGTNNNGDIWLDESEYKTKKFTLYTPVGELLQTYKERPLELGRIETKSLGGGSYKVTVTYHDITFHLNKGPFSKYIRDDKGYLNAGGVKSMEKFDACGKSKGYFVVPDNEYNVIHPGGNGFEEMSEMIVEYGSPVVAPNGDIYIWKRTPENYNIIKWAWVDEATDPKGGPDMPEAVQALPSTSGVYFTWNPSPQDPGCVTGYEIERASSAGGTYSSVATVPLNENQTYNYNDTTAGVGATWYYRIRSTSEIGNSDPVEVSATRP